MSDPNQLVIVIKDTEPEQRKAWLIQAVAASFRWYGKAESVWTEDDKHLIVLAEFIDTLSQENS